MSRRDHFLALRNEQPCVLPSLLRCDFGNLEREVERLERAGVVGYHLDVMDGQFVPNLTYGMPIVAALRRLTTLPLDVHLMIQQPERYVDQFHQAGADSLTVHIEAVSDPRAVLARIRQLGMATGMALNPATELSAIAGCLDLCDLVLVMSVPAGFGGQSFDAVALDKLRQVRSLAGPDMLLQVDGGINTGTIQRCAEAGAQLLVAGSAIFCSDDYGLAIQELAELAAVA